MELGLDSVVIHTRGTVCLISEKELRAACDRQLAENSNRKYLPLTERFWRDIRVKATNEGLFIELADVDERFIEIGSGPRFRCRELKFSWINNTLGFIDLHAVRREFLTETVATWDSCKALIGKVCRQADFLSDAA